MPLSKPTRRDLLKYMLASPMALTLDVEKLLWVPKPMIVVPAMPDALIWHQLNIVQAALSQLFTLDAKTGQWCPWRPDEMLPLTLLPTQSGGTAQQFITKTVSSGRKL